MVSAIWHDPQFNVRSIIPGVGTLSTFDLPEVHETAPQEYEIWRQWRYEHISLDIEMFTLKLGRSMWESKKPWWLTAL